MTTQTCLNTLKRLSVDKQISFAFGALCLVLVLIGGMFFFSLRTIEQRRQMQLARVIQKWEIADQLPGNAGSRQAEVVRHLLETNLEEMARHEQIIRNFDRASGRILTDFEALLDDERERHLFARLVQARKAYLDRTEELLALSHTPMDAEATKEAFTRQSPAFFEYHGVVAELIEEAKKNARQVRADTSRLIRQLLRNGGVLIGLAMLITAGTGLMVVRITRRLRADNATLQNEITGRKRTAVSLRDSEEKFRLLAENITDAFWIRSADFQEVQYLSPGFERIWGRSRESLYANPQQWTECILPEDRERVREAFATLLGEAASLDIEYRIVRPDGEQRWVRARGFPVRDAAGKLIRHTGIVGDITERKRAEEALRESEERFSDAFDYAPIGVGLASLEGRWVKANPALCDLLGYSEVELINCTFQEMTHPDDLGTDLENATRMIAGEMRTYRSEKRYIHARGHVITVLLNVTLVRKNDGAPRYFLAQIQDITERQRAEQETKRTLQRLNEAQRIGQIGDWEWDMATGAITWSPQVFEILGRDPLLGPPRNYEEYAALYDAKNQALLQEGVARSMESGEAQAHELMVLRPDGQVAHIRGMAVCRKDEIGRVLGLYGTVQDITERKHFEEALRASGQRYHSLFDNMLEGYAYCRTHFEGDELRDFTYLEVNGAFAKLTGLKDATGKRVSELIPGIQESNRDLFQVYSRVVRTGQPEKLEVFVAALDLWLSITVYSSARESFVAVFENITQRMRAEEALRTSEAEFRTLAEAMPQIVWVSGQDGSDTYISQQWMDYTGQSMAESLRTGWKGALHPDDQMRTAEAWQRAVATACLYAVECRIRRADGEYCWWLARAAPLQDGDGHILKWFGTCTDIHEMKLAQLEISRAKQEIDQLNAGLEERVKERTKALAAATAEAERANQAKSEFLSRMSHELRTPMNAILGFAQVLETEDGLTDDQRDSVYHILKGGGHLLELINEVLDITSIESGRLTLSSEPVALAGLLTETISLLRPLSAELQIEIAVHASENAGDHVRADRQRLKQVLLNLLGNALKYNRSGGSVTVRYAAVGGSPATTRLSVTDTGLGLSAAKLARLFNPFERLGAEETRVEGTGLGLVLARRMVEHMGGTLGVESAVGEGSTFWIELPTAEAPLDPEETAADLVPVSVPEIPADARVVLYIEDNPSNVRLVTRILARRPAIRLLCAGTGAVGLQMAREHRPDLILLDLHLPDCHGDDVLISLAVDPRTGAIPVVMLTADAVAGKRDAMLASGARGFITKPLDVRNFLGVVDRFLAVEPSGVG